MIKSFRPCVARKQSPLLEAQRLGNKSKKQVSVRELAQALPLTSLIDAFSIIVIYLLIGTQSGGLEIQNPQFSLPVARNSLALEKPVAMLRIENNQIFLNDEPVTLQNLEKKLIKFKNKSNEKKYRIDGSS